MADVFLSYSRASASMAGRIAAILRDAGFSVWFDESLPAHRVYADEISEQLDAAASVIVLWSKEAVASQWVRSEANRARETGRLVQVRLDDARLPMPFDQIQCADLRKWHGETDSAPWRCIVESVAILVGGEGKGTRSPVGVKAGPSRRTMLAGGAAAAALAVAGAYVWAGARSAHETNPKAALLLRKGEDLLQNNDVFAADDAGSLRNAIALLAEATQADPQSGDAWGSLALAYSALKRVSPVSDRQGLDSRCRSAAATALELKENEPRATAALLLLDPVYRHWTAAEKADRAALTNAPRIPLLLFLLSDTLGSVGRWKEAAVYSKGFDRKSFVIPGADRRAVVDLWSAGDLPNADEALKLAVEHWPQQPQVWRTRLAYLMYSGRPSDALTVLEDKSERPADTPPLLVQALEATARAIAGQGNRADAVARNLDYLESTPTATLAVVHACAVLGDAETVFALLQGYYFGEGAWSKAAPPGGDEDRQTSSLFQPPMRNLWHDSRFDKLLERIGLNAYWRKSGTVPDFRRD